LDLVAIPVLVLSFLMVFKGASWLTDSVWDISVRKRVSAGMLGMLVAGLMTTLPELTVSTMSSAIGKAGLSMGNAIGSTIFNIVGIVGIIGLIRPLKFEKAFLRQFGRNAIIVYLVFYLLAFIGRSLGALDALILLAVLSVTIVIGYRQRGVGAPTSEPRRGSTTHDVAILVAGGIVLGLGSYLLIRSATSIAADLGIPEFVIGLSLVAVGTSIPELATGVTSTRKGVEEISIGNVLGANVYNVTLVLGCSALVSVLLHGRPLPAGNDSLFLAIPIMISVTGLLMILGRNGSVSRKTALFFVLLYVAYLIVTFSGIPAKL